MKPSPTLLGVSVLSFLMFILLTAIFPLPVEAAKKSTFARIKDLTWDGKQFIAVGRPGLVMTSPDGVRWTQRSIGEGHEWFESIAWGNGTYVMLSRYKGRDCTFTSQDGLDWKRICPEALVGVGIKRLRWAKNSFIALGKKGLILVSEGGEQWQRLESGTSENLVGLAGGEKNLVIIGQDGLVLKGVVKGPLTAHQQPQLQRANSKEFYRQKVDNVAWSGKEFITVGNLGHGSMFARSEDGENWDLKYFGDLFFNIAWGNGRFVAVGKDIAVSPDGREWQFLNIRSERNGSSIHLKHLIAGGRRFLTTGGDGGSAFISDDGFSWRGGTKVSLDPSGTTILPDKLAKTRLTEEGKESARKKLINIIGHSTFNMSLPLFILLLCAAMLRMHSRTGISEAYETDRGSVLMRGLSHGEKIKNWIRQFGSVFLVAAGLLAWVIALFLVTRGVGLLSFAMSCPFFSMAILFLLAAMSRHVHGFERTFLFGLIGGTACGGIAFIAGFVGPIIFTPNANQGPLFGIFFSGPIGTLVGTVIGVLTGVIVKTTRQPGDED